MAEVNGKSMVSKAIVCGCMATRHKLVGSCLDCGRIVCEKENVSVCPFCKSNVLPPLSADDAYNNGFDESTVKAYKLKVQYFKLI